MPRRFALAATLTVLAVAVIPVAVGITGDDYLDPGAFDDGFTMGLVICAVLCAAGGAVALIGIRPSAPAAAPATETPVHCALSGPPTEAPAAR